MVIFFSFEMATATWMVLHDYWSAHCNLDIDILDCLRAAIVRDMCHDSVRHCYARRAP